jgi:hypothetical protein
MKKLLVLAVLATTAVMGWRWIGEDAEPADRADLVFNRFWIDHLPQGEKDTVQVFALWTPESFGVFANQNLWRVELERFRFEARGERVRAVFPLSGDREEVTVKAARCQETDFDFCLDVVGSKHGTTRYYSRLGRERKDRKGRSVEQFMAELR